MPGSSLWLIPAPTSPFTRTVNTIITATLPYRFGLTKLPTFIPHITLTSNVPAELYGTDAQAWLDSLDLPFAARARTEKATLGSGEAVVAPDQDQLLIVLDALQTEDPFFRKLTLRAAKTMPSPQVDSADVDAAAELPESPAQSALWQLATACRAQGVYQGDFGQARTWADEEYRPHLSLMYADMSTKQVETMIPAITQDLERARANLKPKRGGVVDHGATIVLVPTDQEIAHWKPIAQREVPSAIWKWTST